MATIEDFILRIKVEGDAAVKGMSGGLNNLKKDVEGFSPSGGAFSNVLGGITSKLGGAGTAIFGVAAAIAALGMKAVAIADQLQDISDATGIAAGALSNFQSSIIEAGGKSEDFANIATKLNQTLGEAATGNEAAQKSFQKLGVFVRDANGNVRDSGTVLQEVIGKLAAISDPATRAAVAVEVLGKQAKLIDWTKVNAINDPFKDEYVAALSRFQGKLDSINNSIKDGLIATFGELFLLMEEGFSATRLDGYLANFMAMISGMSKAEILEQQRRNRVALGLEKPLAPGQQPLSPGTRPSNAGAGRGKQGGPTAEELKKFGDFGATPEATLKAIAESEKRIALSRIESNKLVALKGANDIIAVEVNARAELLKAIEEINSKEKISQEQKDLEIAAKTKEINLKSTNDIAKLRMQQNAKIYTELEAQRQKSDDELANEDKRINDIIESSKQLVIEQNNQVTSQQRKNKFLLDNLTATDRERANAQALFDLEEQRISLLRDVAKIKDLPYAERLQQEFDINKKIDARIGLTTKQQELDAAGAEDFSVGWGKAYNQYLENTRNAAGTAASLFQTLTTGFEDAWVKFVKTGKLSFKDLVNSMIADLARAQARNLFASLFGPVGSNNNLSGPAGAAVLGLPGYAAGGMIPANQLSVVGEKGPELFIPKTSGTILPNNMLSSGSPAGLGNTSVTYNINAVDAMSFKSMIARDPSFIHAVAMQGAKGTPGRY